MTAGHWLFHIFRILMCKRKIVLSFLWRNPFSITVKDKNFIGNIKGTVLFEALKGLLDYIDILHIEQ